MGRRRQVATINDESRRVYYSIQKFSLNFFLRRFAIKFYPYTNILYSVKTTRIEIVFQSIKVISKTYIYRYYLLTVFCEGAQYLHHILILDRSRHGISQSVNRCETRNLTLMMVQKLSTNTFLRIYSLIF